MQEDFLTKNNKLGIKAGWLRRQRKSSRSSDTMTNRLNPLFGCHVLQQSIYTSIKLYYWHFILVLVYIYIRAPTQQEEIYISAVNYERYGNNGVTKPTFI